MPRLALTLLALLLLVAGCRTPVTEDVFKEGKVQVFLRAEKSWQLGPLVEKDYSHPLTISPVRIAHILSRIDVRLAGKRLPAIPTDMIYPMAEGISRSLSRAGAEQEVVVMAVETEHSLGIFDHDYLTSFVVYAKGDQLFVYLARIHWQIPAKEKDKPPMPQIGEERMAFRIYASKGMDVLEKQGVAVNWRDPIFARPTRTKVLATGQVVRKTILLESDEEDPTNSASESEAPDLVPQAPKGLSPEQLRALADLEEERRNGAITEAEYDARQQEIMAGELEPPATR